ncbi:MAG TPA: DNA polymerase Y family protein [Mycobacteriales bacterium]|nr:DNA polymerase Y family protein [Mycobacteriales bacterium]
MAVRTLVVSCPDWPLTAAGIGPSTPAVVVVGQRVSAASAAARAAGITVGMRRRLAQSRCPDLLLVDDDPDRDAAAYEPVVAALEQIAPGIEVVRPGLCALASRGPSRYAGGDEQLAAQAVAAVGRGCRVGIADGPFAAELAATRRSAPGSAPRGPAASFEEMSAQSRVAIFRVEKAGRGVAGVDVAQRWVIVPPGRSRRFLAPYPVDVLRRPALADLLHRLGVRTVGDFAALPVPSVVSRFGPDAALAHRLARGLDERPVTARIPPPELTAQLELDPPAAAVEQVLFAAKGLADAFTAGLARHGLTCQRISIEAETEHGERLARLWRHDSALTAPAIVDRVRWQLDGWLSGTARSPDGAPTGGLALIRLGPDQVSAAAGRPLGLWGPQAALDRVDRALARVQGVLGPDAVTTAVPSGGRDPGECAAQVRWGDPRRAPKPVDRPWPGRLPTPAPATVLTSPQPVQVVSSSGDPVMVTDRCEVTAPPARVCVGSGSWQDVTGWAGPWPASERWWDRHTADSRRRFQLTTGDGSALLVTERSGSWYVDAVYD